MLPSAFHTFRHISAWKHWAGTVRCLKEFRRTGTTSSKAYQNMIRLFCKTNGHGLDLLHDSICRNTDKYVFPQTSGALGNVTNTDVTGFVDEIRRRGYVIFPNRLPEDRCAALEQFARTREARVLPPTEGNASHDVYDSNNRRGNVYRFDEQTLLECEEIQNLIADYSLLSVAQEYLECPPIIDIASMWWSLADSSATKSLKNTAAQLYHFDMDRIKWVKMFVYLSDVTTTGGPHCFVEGTHLAGSYPRQILKRGYERLTDEEVGRYYPSQQIIELTGRRGTMLAVDTRALHKGKPPVSNDRLVVQFSYCNSLFGGDYFSPEIPEQRTDELQEALQRYPILFSRYSKQDASRKSTKRAA